MLVKHRKTNKRFRVLGSHYDGNRGLLYCLIVEDASEGKKERYFFDRQSNYTKVPKRREQ